MKLKMMIAVAVAALFLSAGIVYAGNGDLIVNGNLGVGTTAGATPAAKAEINGSLLVNGTATVKGNMTINTTTTDTTTINGAATINGTTTVNGTATMKSNAIVNGNVGVGTSAPTQKLDVNGYVKGTGICIGSNCTTTLHVSGGLYGYCMVQQPNVCSVVKSPATCSVSSFTATCYCPTGYSSVKTGSHSVNSPTELYAYYACYKN